MRLGVLATAATLLGAVAAAGAGGPSSLKATLGGVPKLHASFAGRLDGGSLTWTLTSTAPATSAELVGAGPAVRLCRPCTFPARGKATLTAAQVRRLFLQQGVVRLRTAKGLVSGSVRVGPTLAAGSSPQAANGGPAGNNWTATAVALRGQNGNRFEFVCPPNASANAGPVWGGGNEYFTDTSAVCAAAVITGDILLQAGGLVVIEIVPGQPAYFGTTSNGITSQSSGPAQGSFVVVHDS